MRQKIACTTRQRDRCIARFQSLLSPVRVVCGRRLIDKSFFTLMQQLPRGFSHAVRPRRLVVGVDNSRDLASRGIGGQLGPAKRGERKWQTIIGSAGMSCKCPTTSTGSLMVARQNFTNA